MAPKGSGGARQPLSQRRPKATAVGRPPATRAARVEKGSAPRPATPTPAPSPARGGGAAAARRPSFRLPRSVEGRRAHADILYQRLVALYPDAHCELDFRTPFELVTATILSAQCTDKRVNMVTPQLFGRYPNARALAAANQEDVEEIIRSTGFFRAKAKALIGMARALVERHDGEVPSDMSALVVLPGVGRKTANVVLGNAFGMNEGIVVDTHVGRLAARLGLSTEKDPVKIEQALMPLFPTDRWTMLSHLLIWHGRRVCNARKPRCGDCALAELCPSSLRPR